MTGHRGTVTLVLVLLLLAWGSAAEAGSGSGCVVDPLLFDYTPHRDNAEAEQLAMTLSDELRAPDHEYERILRDLALIRERYPNLLSVVDDPDYVADQLIIDLDPAMPWDDYQATNDFYQMIDEDLLFGNTYVLTFCDSINAPQLAAIYDDLPEINFAEPNGLFGTDDRITIVEIGTRYRYTIEDGFHDCTDGCDCERLWIVDVEEDGTVSLVFYGESGASYCTFSNAACCLGDSCDMLAIQGCLDREGAPQPFGVFCDDDVDGDGVDAGCGDNCPTEPNPTQADDDVDGIGNVCDNCPAEANPDQGDNDADLVGTACDNCPTTSNPDQIDGDHDNVGDLCDNCPTDPNLSQVDHDQDAIGDRCDEDDGLIYIYFQTAGSVAWHDEVGFDSWNSYKGDLDVLTGAGIYTQLPGSNPLAAAQCGLAAPSAPDAIPPASGKVAFFLTTGVADGMEGRLGRDGQGVPRPNDNPCP